MTCKSKAANELAELIRAQSASLNAKKLQADITLAQLNRTENEMLRSLITLSRESADVNFKLRKLKKHGKKNNQDGAENGHNENKQPQQHDKDISVLQNQKTAIDKQLESFTTPDAKAAYKALKSQQRALEPIQGTIQQWNDFIAQFQGEILPHFRECTDALGTAKAREFCKVALDECELKAKSTEAQYHQLETQINDLRSWALGEQKRLRDQLHQRQQECESTISVQDQTHKTELARILKLLEEAKLQIQQQSELTTAERKQFEAMFRESSSQIKELKSTADRLGAERVSVQRREQICLQSLTDLRQGRDDGYKKLMATAQAQIDEVSEKLAAADLELKRAKDRVAALETSQDSDRKTTTKALQKLQKQSLQHKTDIETIQRLNDAIRQKDTDQLRANQVVKDLNEKFVILESTNKNCKTTVNELKSENVKQNTRCKESIESIEAATATQRRKFESDLVELKTAAALNMNTTLARLNKALEENKSLTTQLKLLQGEKNKQSEELKSAKSVIVQKDLKISQEQEQLRARQQAEATAKAAALAENNRLNNELKARSDRIKILERAREELKRQEPKDDWEDDDEDDDAYKISPIEKKIKENSYQTLQASYQAQTDGLKITHQDQVDQLKKQINQLQTQTTNIQDEFENYRLSTSKKIEEQTSDIDDLTELLTDAKTQVNILTRQSAQLKEQLITLQGKQKEMEDTTQKLVTAQSQITNLKQQINALTNLHNACLSQNDESEQREEQCNADLRKLERQYAAIVAKQQAVDNDDDDNDDNDDDKKQPVWHAALSRSLLDAVKKIGPADFDLKIALEEVREIALEVGRAHERAENERHQKVVDYETELGVRRLNIEQVIIDLIVDQLAKISERTKTRCDEANIIEQVRVALRSAVAEVEGGEEQQKVDSSN